MKIQDTKSKFSNLKQYVMQLQFPSMESVAAGEVGQQNFHFSTKQSHSAAQVSTLNCKAFFGNIPVTRLF